MSPAGILYLIAQLDAGGTERQLLHLIRGLDRSRFAPEVVTFTPRGALEPDFASLCPVRLLPKTRAREPLVLAGLWRLLRSGRPSLLHTCLFPANWRGALAGRLAGVPRIVGSVRNVSTWMGAAGRAAERLATRLADAVIVNAPAVGRFMVEQVGVRASRLRVIPNGVDLDAHRPARAGDPDVRASLDLGGAREVVGAIMSLSAKKNPLDLVDAAAAVAARRPGAAFVLAGEGPLRGAIEARAAAAGLGGRLRLLGLRRDVPDLLRSFDLLVLPSGREGLPNVVLEAMATGLPVVATDVGGTSDLVEDGVTGRLVAPGRPDLLAAAITEILGDPALAKRMGEAGLRRARADFSLEAMVRRTTALYDALLADAERGRVEAGAGAAARRAGGA